LSSTGAGTHNTFAMSGAFKRNGLWVALSALPFVALVVFVVRYGITIPYMDQWELVPLLEKQANASLVVADFTAQHNAHRIVFPRLIMVGLAALTDWDIRAELAVNLILGLVIFAVIVWQFVLTQGDSGRFPVRLLTVVAAFGVFNLAQWRNWLWGWQLQIFLCVAAALAAIVLLYRGGWAGFIGAALAAFVATFSFGSGMAVWPAGLVVLLCVPWRGMTAMRVAWVVAGAVCIAAYLCGFERPSDASPPGSWNAWLIGMPVYVAAYIGGGIFNGDGIVAAAVGVFGIILFAFLVYRRTTDSPGSRIIAGPYVAIGVFVLLTALITAAGRSGEGIEQAVASRYATLGIPFWIAVAALAVSPTGNAIRFGKEYRPATEKVLGAHGLAVFVAVLLAVHSVHGWWAGSQRGAYFNSLRDELVSGENAPELERLYPDVETLLERRAFLERKRLTVFRE